MFRISTPTLLCPAAWVTPLSVCGSHNCCTFVRLHINVVSVEPTPALLVALRVCLPVAAVTVEVEPALLVEVSTTGLLLSQLPHQYLWLDYLMRSY